VLFRSYKVLYEQDHEWLAKAQAENALLRELEAAVREWMQHDTDPTYAAIVRALAALDAARKGDGR
jgi:hypothetical protein